MNAARTLTLLGLVGIAALAGRSAVAAAQTVAAPARPSTTAERLASVGRLWGEIKYFHPWLAYRRIAWDSAFVATYPRIRSATSSAEFAAAVQQLLDALGDPATRVVEKSIDAPAPAPSAALARWMPDSTLVLTVAALGDLDDYMTIFARLDSVAQLVVASRAVILDFRGTRVARDPLTDTDVSVYFSEGWTGTAFQRHFVADPLVLPARRARMYSGLPPEHGGTSGGYYSAFYVVDGTTILPVPGASARPLAVIVDEHSSLPEVVIALHGAGRAIVVADGGIPPNETITRWGVGTQRLVELTDSVTVTVLISEPLVASDTLAADTTLAGGLAPQVALDVASARLADAASRRTPSPVERHHAPPAVAHEVPPLDSSAYPAAGARVLAAYRFWNAIHFFYPYKHLMGEDWNAALPTAIAELEAAGDSLAYVLALNAFVRRIHDSHGGFRNPTLAAHSGTGQLPLEVRFIEERPIVTRLLDSTARAAGFRVGDEILQVDGQAAARRRATMFVPGAFSTPQSEAERQGRYFLRGRMGSEATVLVRNGDGRARALTMTRVAPTPTWGETTEPSYKLLPNGVGYADLSRLQVPQVDSMFERFRDTRAIVFDMRGYPNGTAWAIAPRLADRPGKAAARFRRPFRLSPDTLDESTTEFVQTIPPSGGKPRYTGRTVMLIDERAVSQAEHTGLFFEAANGTAFVGSPTTGANGDVTTVLAPGGVEIRLTGHDVRHADGRQLQRIGLQPHVPVRPTIKGVRAGRDEVLEAALKYLKE